MISKQFEKDLLQQILKLIALTHFYGRKIMLVLSHRLIASSFRESKKNFLMINHSMESNLLKLNQTEDIIKN